MAARTHVDLFSGIGGFSLAAHWAGYSTVQFVESDAFCQSVLRHHWPEVPIHADINDFDGRPLAGTVDLLTGGFPCQPYSVAGRQRGAADDRALWPAMRRTVEEIRPRWLIAENVPGFIGMGLDDLLVDLETLGYETGALVVPAAGVGAPHRRDRLWVVAFTDGSGESAQSVHAKSAAGILDRHANGDLERPQLALRPWADTESGGTSGDGAGTASVVADAERSQRGASASRGNDDHWHHADWEEAASWLGERGAHVSDADSASEQGRGARAEQAGWTKPRDVRRDDADAAGRGLQCGGASWEGGQPTQPRQALSHADRLGGHPLAEILSGDEGEHAGGGTERHHGPRCGGPSRGRRSGDHQCGDHGGNRGVDEREAETESRLGGGNDGLPAGLDLAHRWLDGTWERDIARTVLQGYRGRGKRLSSLGNAIVPQVAYEIIRHIKLVDR